MSMAVQVEAVVPKKAEDLIVGGFYWIRGTDSSGLPMPPQMVRIRSGQVNRSNVMEAGWVFIEFWADMGTQGRLYYEKEMLPLASVNIPEHGGHDRHLVRIGDELLFAVGLLRGANKAQDYAETVGPPKGMSWEDYKDMMKKMRGRSL
jgi:hypothetical protein